LNGREALPGFPQSDAGSQGKVFPIQTDDGYGIHSLNTGWANGEISACFGGANSPLSRASLRPPNFPLPDFFHRSPYLQ
jgi:hypothetical protein